MIDKNFERVLNKILNKVDKPARYIGGEVNSIKADFDKAKVRFAFSYPDIYEIGMSYNGMDLIYELVNREGFLCERVFAPWVDMEGEMRKEGLPLFSLESKRPIKDFDFFGFTLQYDMSYTNILNMLDLAGIPLRSANRTEDDPIIIAGGPCAVNPEPMADYIDIFLLGDGEDLIPEVLRLYAQVKDEGLSRDDFLEKALDLEGTYVPKYYKEIYQGQKLVGRETLHPRAKEIISKRWVEDFDSCYHTQKPIIPHVQSVHDRVVTEIFRGCTQGCRFCQAGMTYRPIRNRSVQSILDQSSDMLAATGYDDISLSSLSTCDFPELNRLVDELQKKYQGQNIRISLPSLRLDSDSLGVLKQIQKAGRKTGLTFAPEAGSQRLRDVINKNITDEDIENAVAFAFREGYSTIKLYFMIGLPTEEKEDLDGIVKISKKIVDMFFDQDSEDQKGNLKVSVSSSCFVPKPFTPFQWEKQDDLSTMYDKANYIRKQMRDPKASYSYHDPRLSMLECVVTRGDRRLGSVIERAFKKGCIFDSWAEHFKYYEWLEAFEEEGIDLAYYTRELDQDERLPWDFIDVGVSKEFLARERAKAYGGSLSPDCRNQCYACGVNKKYKGVYCP